MNRLILECSHNALGSEYLVFNLDKVAVYIKPSNTGGIDIHWSNLEKPSEIYGSAGIYASVTVRLVVPTSVFVRNKSKDIADGVHCWK